LLQHKDNPVDWWPWSEEAFAAARERDVPVLLSVGYAACHWCQVTRPSAEIASSQVGGVAAVRYVPDRVEFSPLVRSLVCLSRLSAARLLVPAGRAIGA
jgi:hypothetical protein